MIRRLGLLSLSAFLLVSCEDSVLPTDADGPLLRHQRSNADFTVNSSDDVYDGICDSSHCSLREAIIAANAKPGTDVIAFRIPGSGVHTIQPLTELPIIIDPVVLDGYTQRGARQGSRSRRPGIDARLKIELDGGKTLGARGLTVQGGNSTIRGLIINRFDGYAAIELAAGGGNVVEGNFIGTDPSGTMALGNLRGVAASGSSNNTIIRNLISGNNQVGVFLLSSHQNRIAANIIGTQVDRVSPLGNAGVGVFTTFDASNNMIGGSSAGEGNTIAFNSDGVMIFSGIGNSILSNSIFLNRNPSFSFGGMGIDLDGYDQGVTPNDIGDGDTGGNERQNFPVLTLASSRKVEGSLNSTPNTKLILQFFGNEVCDPSGYGEGQHVIGSMKVTTDASGNASFRFRPRRRMGNFAGRFITATATDPAGNTSEFSKCFDVMGQPPATYPRIDGVLRPGEWDAADRFGPVTVILPGGGTTKATVFVMNTQADLLLAVRFNDNLSSFETHTIAVRLDENPVDGVWNAGADGLGDDGLVVQHTALGSRVDAMIDEYFDSAVSQGQRDDTNGGSNHGVTAVRDNRSTTTIEMSHPLNSGDVRDAALVQGQTFGLWVFTTVVETIGPSVVIERTDLIPEWEVRIVR